MKSHLLLALSLITGVAGASPVTAAHKPVILNAQQKAAADVCLEYVSYRLGHMMGLAVTQVAIPTPPATLWLVVGEDKQQARPISFVCHLDYQQARWALEKLELLQLNSATLPAPAPSTNGPGAPAN